MHDVALTEVESTAKHCRGLVCSDKYPREGRAEVDVGSEISLTSLVLVLMEGREKLLSAYQKRMHWSDPPETRSFIPGITNKHFTKSACAAVVESTVFDWDQI